MKRGLLIVTLGYFLSRIWFYVIGIRFEGMDNLDKFLQIIDPPLLEHHLLSSLYYSSFPPLYNLVIGVTLKLFGKSAAAFAVEQLLAGWALALVLFALMADLGIGGRLAAAATVLFLALPPVILYENWLFYSYFETLLFTLAAWSFLRFVRRPAAGWGLALFSCYAALALLNARMMFFALIIGFFLWWIWRREGVTPRIKRATLVSTTPVLLVLFVMAKNAWLFGAFTVDPHFGFHMANGLIFSVWRDPETHAVCEQEYPMLLIPPTKLPPDAAKIGLEPLAPTGIPLLDEPYRSGGQPNFHNRFYLEASQLYSQAITDFVERHPRLYAKFVRQAFFNYWQPSDDYLYFPPENRNVLGVYDYLYNAAYPLLLILYLAGILYALHAGWRERWRSPEAATLGFIVATIAYTMLAIFVTYGENDRYKFTVEPLLWILVVYCRCGLRRIQSSGDAQFVAKSVVCAKRWPSSAA